MISLSSSRNYLLTLENTPENVKIHVLDLQRGDLLATLDPSEQMLKRKLQVTTKVRKDMGQISTIYYDEVRHEIITGHDNGQIYIWS